MVGLIGQSISTGGYPTAVLSRSTISFPSHAGQDWQQHAQPIQVVLGQAGDLTYSTLERVQRRATKYILNDYHSPYKTTLMQLPLKV